MISIFQVQDLKDLKEVSETMTRKQETFETKITGTSGRRIPEILGTETPEISVTRTLVISVTCVTGMVTGTEIGISAILETDTIVMTETGGLIENDYLQLGTMMIEAW